MSPNEDELPQQPQAGDDDWYRAYEALVLENDDFDADEAVLLLKLLENPDLLRDALEIFAGVDDDGEEVAEDA